MTVEELITSLQRLPPKSVVYCNDRTTGYIIKDASFYDFDTQSILEIQWIPDSEDPS